MNGSFDVLVRKLSADSDSDLLPDISDHCPLDNDCDDDGSIDSEDSDDDDEKVLDAAEPICGSYAAPASSRPERVDGEFESIDDDGDTPVDEALPAGSANFDCDGDGFKGSAENHVFSYLSQTNGDQKTCQEYDTSFVSQPRPSLRWPSDLRGDGISPTR